MRFNWILVLQVFSCQGKKFLVNLGEETVTNSTDQQGNDYIFKRTSNPCRKWWFCPKWGLCVWCVRCLNWQEAQKEKEKESQHTPKKPKKPKVNEIGQEPIFMGIGQEPIIAKRSLDILPKKKKGFPDYGGKSIPKSMNGCSNRCEVFKEVQKACRNKWVFRPRKKKKTNKGSKGKGEEDVRVLQL